MKKVYISLLLISGTAFCMNNPKKCPRDCWTITKENTIYAGKIACDTVSRFQVETICFTYGVASQITGHLAENDRLMLLGQTLQLLSVGRVVWRGIFGD